MRLFNHLLLLLLFTFSSAFAFEKTATTAAAFLQIDAGSRAASMGGAGVGLASGPDALFLNPAAAWNGQSMGFTASHSQWFADLEYQSIAFSTPYKHNYNFGLSILSFGGDPIAETTLEQQEGTGLDVEFGDIAVAGSVLMRMTDRFVVGSSLKYVHQKLHNETASTFAFDIGTLLKTSFPGLNIGMSMRNLGGDMKLEGRDLLTGQEENEIYETSEWPLPLMFQTGIGWKMVGKNNAYFKNDRTELSLAADARHLNEGLTTGHVGLEFGLMNSVFLRSGRTFNHDTQQWAFGGGVRLEMYKLILIADFAYADMGDLDAVQRISLTLMSKN